MRKRSVTLAIGITLIAPLVFGCSRGVTEGLRTGVEQGFVTGMSSVIAAVFSAASGAVFGMDAAGGQAGAWTGP